MEKQKSIKTDRRRATVYVVKEGNLSSWRKVHELITMHCYENEYRCDDGYHLIVSFHQATTVSRTGISYITARPAREKDDPAQLEDRLLNLIRRKLMNEGWRFGVQVHVFPQSEGAMA